jgi:hypothetical protein
MRCFRILESMAITEIREEIVVDKENKERKVMTR